MASGTRGKVQSDDSDGAFKRQGSFRKVLPPFTTVDEVGGTSIVTSSAAKMIDRPPSSVSDSKNDSLFSGNGRGDQNGIEYIVAQEYNMIYEYQLVLKQSIPGLYVMPSANTGFLWFGVYFIHEGMYEGGIFRFQVRIPSTYPKSGPPKFTFDTPIFHPMVDPQTGDLRYRDIVDAMEEEEKKSDSSHRALFGASDQGHQTRHIWEILVAVQFAMHNLETNNPLNMDAAELYRNNAEIFAQKAAESVKQSLEHIFDPPLITDPHYFVFSKYDEEIHDQYRKQLLNLSPSENSSSSSTFGLSWVQPGTLIPFSKKPSFL